MSGLPQVETDLVSGSAAGRAQLEFDDNLLLPVLYGERDQHLDRIERQLGVSLIRAATGCRSPVRRRRPKWPVSC